MSLKAAIAVPGLSVCEQYSRVRNRSMALIATLTAEDCAIQTMPDVSPAKWHLAHTTWFFETFVLVPHFSSYRVFDTRFGFLFNSYYEAVGPRHARPQRGHLSRPDLNTIKAYRAHVDEAMQAFLGTTEAQTRDAVIRLGLHHEQQHQELMLTDIKHVLGTNPLRPAYQDLKRTDGTDAEAVEPQWITRPAGLAEIGLDAESTDFSFDNESPQHRVWLDAYRLSNRPVTQSEWLAFIDDGGYRTASLWLSDGWAWVQQNEIKAPLYWSHANDGWSRYSLNGLRSLDDTAEGARPVSHISFYEAAAFAQWAGARLPTESEWEACALDFPVVGDFSDSQNLDPQIFDSVHPGRASHGLFGGVWEWTASAYSPYPGFQAPRGALGEYNAKFMASQMVLRGGSCATPRDHIRASYRNFFYPHQRWQFTGLRLAQNA